MAKRQAGSCELLKVFGLTQLEIETESTVSVADTLSTLTLINWLLFFRRIKYCTSRGLSIFVFNNQRWSRENNARCQGQGHKKLP